VSLATFLGRLVGRLDAAAVPYMVTGSVASAFHGLPRTTADVDVVIDVDREALDRLLARLHDADFYVNPHDALDALRRHGVFNAVDRDTGWKADLFVQQGRPFSREELRRRSTVDLLGVPVSVASAEDCILSKLEWATKTPSERQLRDAAGIVAVQGSALDLAYLDRWAHELGVSEPWNRIRSA